MPAPSVCHLITGHQLLSQPVSNASSTGCGDSDQNYRLLVFDITLDEISHSINNGIGILAFEILDQPCNGTQSSALYTTSSYNEGYLEGR